MKVIYIGNPLLRLVSKKIEVFDEKLREFVEELSKAMYVEDGVGLAAPQVGVSKRIFVYDAGEGIRVVINPEFLWKSEETVQMEEGCLSIPGIYADLFRPSSVKLRYQDVEGNFHEEELSEYAARIVQHEADHLEGVLFVDHLSSAKRALLKSKLNQIMREKV
ncbi:MAG TPA: peptide deformylase [Mesotoga sp.]|jgi:peptide deformylase|nr:peptide deformylase [Mesotoga sp.]MDI9375141.1 peptide deformylase [Thermotogota bacterium]MDD5744211.1 peptide deformylase [Mesotoga sp.]HOI64696.1 peptide deformylase [Mesotoga sp.]HPB64035.1 peptide deformylase [Mesotoga sp.]